MSQHQHDDNCRDVFAMLSQYLDRELPPDALREIEAHIAGCEPCIEFTESLRKTVNLCRSYQPEDIPEPIAMDAKAKLKMAYERMLASKQISGGSNQFS